MGCAVCYSSKSPTQQVTSYMKLMIIIMIVIIIIIIIVIMVAYYTLTSVVGGNMGAL